VKTPSREPGKENQVETFWPNSHKWS